MARTSKVRGFTLIEMMVTVAILSILSMLAIAGMQRMRPAAATSATAGELVRSLSSAQKRAIAEGADIYFVFQAPQGANAGWYVVYLDWDRSFDPMALNVTGAGMDVDYMADMSDATAEVGTGFRRDRIIEMKTLRHNAAPVPISEFVALSGNTVDHIPPPFQVANYAGVNTPCTFCDGNGRGWIRFLPRGEVRFSNEPVTTLGGALAIGGVLRGEETPHARLVVVSSPFGLVRSFSHVR